jgi:hypothetical protein
MPDYAPEFRSKHDRVLRSIRTATHKLIWSSNGRHELYDLTADPGERHNIIALRPDIASQLGEKLEAWLQSINGFGSKDAESPGPEGRTEDPELLQRLVDLGYLV